MKILCIFIVSFFFLLSSCTQRVLDFTIVSSKNIDIEHSHSFIKKNQRTQGKDMVHWIILIPTGVPHIKEALDKAIESTPGCVALMDGVITYKFWWIPYVYGKEYYIVEGTPLIDPNSSSYIDSGATYGKIELDSKGEVKKIENFNESQYQALKNKYVKGTK